MITIHLSVTEINILQRAFALAEATGKWPDASIEGDALRTTVLRQQLQRALETHKAETWGKPKVQR